MQQRPDEIPQEEPSDYINANWIGGATERSYIATQGPIHATLEDFWHMMWQEEVRVVVMVTNEVEQGKVKCDRYWPSNVGDTRSFGPYSVTFSSTEDMDSHHRRSFSLRCGQAQPREVVQFAYLLWPDHGAPSCPAEILELRTSVHKYLDTADHESPIVVHCSAGVGRSGSFIAIDRIVNTIATLLEEGTYNSVADNWSPDVCDVVRDMRMQRNLMVQTLEQYVFVYQAVLYSIRQLLGDLELKEADEDSDCERPPLPLLRLGEDAPRGGSTA